MIKNINVYTDGSTINNGKENASGGFGVYFPDFNQYNISEPFLKDIPTNQKTELYAIYIALKTCKKIIKEEDANVSINIYTDSSYSIKCLTEWLPTWIKNDWKKADGKDVKNKEILVPLYKEYSNLKKSYTVNINHIRSHTGKSDYNSISNEIADKLALLGSSKHPNFGLKKLI